MRTIFEKMCRVDGLRHVRRAQSSAGPSGSPCRVSLMTPKNGGTFDGRCRDPEGIRERVQSFRVRVHDPERSWDKLRALRGHVADNSLFGASADAIAARARAAPRVTR